MRGKKQAAKFSLHHNFTWLHLYSGQNRKVTLEMSPKLSLLNSHWDTEPTSHNQEGTGCQKQVSLQDVVRKQVSKD